MIIKKGEIYLANLSPTIGAEISNKRPVLIVSNDINNEYAETVTILPITSKTDRIYPFEVSLLAGEGDIKENSKIKAT
jgi:mRNA interferase MazF